MKSPQLTAWLNELIAQIIEGASDAFLITAGGSAVLQSGALAATAVTPKQLGVSVLLGAALYLAAFLKKHPTPTSMPVPASTRPEPRAQSLEPNSESPISQL